ncbi:MAG: DinB family protein, partial [Dehalococcoidia bacterium]
MFLSAVGRLYDYQSEVNNHLLDVASRISRDEFTSVLIEGQPSIQDTLVHMVGVIQINVSWWDG